MGRGLLPKIRNVMILLSILLLSACHSSSSFETMKDADTVDVPVIQKVTRETYMNGKQFCERYTNTSDPKTTEYGKWITVPVDYKNPENTVQIYAYTKKPFNPSISSFIFVDGGPGQNTHMLDPISEEFNEIHFDQRGVGCSAPGTWDDYTNPNLYSSESTTRDIDEVRKAYGISKVSVYGISYGTIPATIYGHLFEENVRAVVLEGVLGKVENLRRYTYKVEKYNLVLEGLNEKQRASFDRIMNSIDEKMKFVIERLLMMAGYRDGGYRTVRDLLKMRFMDEAGEIQADEFEKAYRDIRTSENPYNHPQHPGAVDENVLIRFYCKELGAFSKDKFVFGYSKVRKEFVEEQVKGNTRWADDCAEQNITLDMENTYDERRFTTSAPVYYFQGSHDGATLADGALEHWKNVPKKESYFLMSLKGGHNPALGKVESKDKNVSKAHKALFAIALAGSPIDRGLIKNLNDTISNSTEEYVKNRKYNTWELFTSNKSDFTDIQKESNGLGYIQR